jgi:hypothetical protein
MIAPDRREYNRAYYSRNKERIKPLKRRAIWKWRGMDVESISRPEPRECEACGLTQAEALHCDHDHSTGKFRGWLCRGCNRALGLLGESQERALKLAQYMGYE